MDLPHTRMLFSHLIHRQNGCLRPRSSWRPRPRTPWSRPRPAPHGLGLDHGVLGLGLHDDLGLRNPILPLKKVREYPKVVCDIVMCTFLKRVARPLLNRKKETDLYWWLLPPRLASPQSERVHHLTKLRHSPQFWARNWIVEKWNEHAIEWVIERT